MPFHSAGSKTLAWHFIERSSSMRTRYAGQTTTYVVLVCLMAACSGLMVGYVIGIAGGVTSMDDFLQEFFPIVYNARRHSTNNYCQYNNQSLQAVTSSLYLAGMLASLGASVITTRLGRTRSIFIGGSTFMIGAILNGAAQNLVMLILGRLFLGSGIGFACQAVPLYLSEMAPTHLRGALNIMFQLIITVSIFCANLINYGMGKLTPWGWRASLGLAAIPGVIVTLGSLFLPETPNSLLERGRIAEARAILENIRGTPFIHEEFDDMTNATSAIRHQYINLLQRKYAPQLVVGIFICFFNQMTGINAIMFHAPQLLKIMGFGSNATFYSTVVLGAVLIVSTLVAIAVVDKWGRKPLFYESGIQMFVSLIAVGVILDYNLGLHGHLSKTLGIIVVILMCSFVSSFAWSWGPLLWLIPSEIFPIEIRASGVGIAMAVNLFWTLAISQSFLTLLCVMKFGIFLFFGGWVALMTLFITFFYPETKSVPIEKVVHLFQKHWFWKRFVPIEEELPGVLDSGGLHRDSWTLSNERHPGVVAADVDQA